MPDLINMTWAEAQREYGEWLRMDPQQEYSPDFPRDHIMSQSVEADKTINPRQTTVVVTVSKGPDVVFMPDFERRMPILGEEVIRELEGLGLRVQPVRTYDAEIPHGFFVRSDRKPNDQIDKGATVRVWISEGDIVSLTHTRVPDLFGLTEHQATQNATNHRLRVKVEQDNSDEEMIGKVIRQSIAANEQVENETEVIITIGTGPEIDPNAVVRQSYIELIAPEGVSGDYEFKLYVDGVLDSANSWTQNPSITKEIRREFENSGIRLYSLAIRNPRNDEERLYATYRIDFTQEIPLKEVLDRNPEVFRDLNPVATTTLNPVTVPPSTTPPPPPNTTPPYPPYGND
jgi:beta-lactam-binding protein with PASTA domain